MGLEVQNFAKKRLPADLVEMSRNLVQKDERRSVRKLPDQPGDAEDKPKQKGGILVMRARCENQKAVVVAEADGKILVANRAAASRG
mgnify:CR=1 FL=1